MRKNVCYLNSLQQYVSLILFANDKIRTLSVGKLYCLISHLQIRTCFHFNSCHNHFIEVVFFSHILYRNNNGLKIEYIWSKVEIKFAYYNLSTDCNTVVNCSICKIRCWYDLQIHKPWAHCANQSMLLSVTWKIPTRPLLIIE